MTQVRDDYEIFNIGTGQSEQKPLTNTHDGSTGE